MMVDSEFLSTFQFTGKPRPDEKLIPRARTQGRSESPTFRARTETADGEETRPISDVLTTEGKQYLKILKRITISELFRRHLQRHEHLSARRVSQYHNRFNT